MAEPPLKNHEAFSDESDAFQLRFDSMEEEKASEELWQTFLTDIRAWLCNCVQHGRFLPPGSAERRAFKGMLEYWNSMLRQHGRRLEGLDRLAEFDPKAGVPLRAKCPYPGLEPYTPEHGQYFFGRETLIEKYVAHLEDPAKRILLIVGASGSGKSSLALAGVLPRLQKKYGKDWVFAGSFTPGADPVRAMTQAIFQGACESNPEAAYGLADVVRLADNPDSALAMFAELCGRRPLFLIVDQFEELFTICRGPARQNAFADVLWRLCRSDAAVGDFQCRVMLTLRTDHLARFESNDALKPLYSLLVSEGNDFNLGAIGFADIKRAIGEPARKVGLRFVPPELVDELASQTAGLANGLPLLQFALRLLWDTRPRDANGDSLDFVARDMVSELPDVQGALGRIAGEHFKAFTPQQQSICERLLLELVVLDENIEVPLRRRRAKAELMTVLSERFAGSKKDIPHVIDDFVGAGLLCSFGDVGACQIEIAHEALLRNWAHINQMVTGGTVKERLHLIKQIGREAAEWLSRERAEGYLNLRKERLARALACRDEGWLTEAESAEYVEACHARALDSEQRERDAKELSRQAEARVAKAEAQVVKEQAQRRRILLGGGLVTLILAVIMYSAQQQRIAAEKLSASNRNAFASLSNSLAPWDGLDLAYTLASKEHDENVRLVLAHALERLESTWQLGSRRDTAPFPNRDGSAIYTLDRARDKEAIRIFRVGEDGQPDAVALELEFTKLGERLESLNMLSIGPPVAASGERLAILVLRAEGNKMGFRFRAFALPKSGTDVRELGVHFNDAKLRSAIEQAQRHSEISFDGTGTAASLVTVNYQIGQSTVYDLKRTQDRLDVVAVPDPLDAQPDHPREGGPYRPATLVAPRGRTDTPELITARLFGTVYCGDRRVENILETKNPDEIGALVTHPETDVFAIHASDGRILTASCNISKAYPPPDTGVPVANPGSVNLTVQSMGDNKVTVLSYMEGSSLRCWRFDGTPERPWRYHPCNPYHHANLAVLLKNGHQLVNEAGGIAMIHKFPNEDQVFNARRSALEGRRAGQISLRWTSAARLFRDGTVQSTGTGIPWRLVGRELEALEGRFIQWAALSADGTHMAWIEWNGMVWAPGQCKLGSGTPWIPPASAESERVGDQSACQSGISLKRPLVPASYSDPQYTNSAAAVAVDSAGRIALVFQQSSNANRKEPPTTRLSLGGTDLTKWSDTREGPPSCLEFSDNGRWLVSGTARGLRKVDLHASPPKVDILREPVDAATNATDASASLSSCAIDDDGQVVVGYFNGGVELFDAADRPQILSRKPYYAFSVAVKSVSFQRAGGRRLVVALGSLQPNNCSRPGLQGQSLRIWDLDLPEKELDTPVANTCFPNEFVLATGPFRPAETLGKPLEIELMTNERKERWHPCHGCALEGEAPSMMLDRLLAKAKDQHAQILGEEKLKTRYGLGSGR